MQSKKVPRRPYGIQQLIGSYLSLSAVQMSFIFHGCYVFFFARFAKCTGRINVSTASHTNMGWMRAVALNLREECLPCSSPFVQAGPAKYPRI